jgi:hypothetical protein
MFRSELWLALENNERSELGTVSISTARQRTAVVLSWRRAQILIGFFHHEIFVT